MHYECPKIVCLFYPIPFDVFGVNPNFDGVERNADTLPEFHRMGLSANRLSLLSHPFKRLLGREGDLPRELLLRDRVKLCKGNLLFLLFQSREWHFSRLAS